MSQEILSIDSFEEQIRIYQSEKILPFKDGQGFIYVEDANDDVLNEFNYLQLDDNDSIFIIAEELVTLENETSLDLEFLNGSFYRGIFSDSTQVRIKFWEFNLSLDRDINKVSGLSMTKIFDYSCQFR